MDRKYYIDVDQLQILDDGSLPRGYYWYKVTAILNGERTEYSNTLKVYAPHKFNTIGLFWDGFADAVYEIIRWTVEEKGEIIVPGPPYYFDNGLIEFR